MWDWFGLSYASYLVVPRTLLCGMPVEWQERMVALLNELNETYDYSKIKSDYSVLTRGTKGRIVYDELRNYRHPSPLPYREAPAT